MSGVEQVGTSALPATAALAARPWRVLHFSESSETGGAETVLLNLVEGLPAAEFESTVLLLKPGWLVDQLEQIGVQPVLIPSRHRLDVPFLRAMRRLLRHERIQLVHAHLPDANAYAVLAAALTRVPVVATYHGMLRTLKPPTVFDRLKLFLVRRLARHVVGVSDALREELVTWAGVPPEQCTTIYNGVDWSRFESHPNVESMRASLDIPPEATVLGMVSDLRPAKGYEYLVRATARLLAKNHNVVTLLIGDEAADTKAMLTAEVRRLGIEHGVRFLGFRSDVPELLSMLQVFIMASTSEGMSIATVEAMGAGVPVVVARSGGPENLIEDGVTGLLVPVRNDAALAERIEYLLTHPERARQMADAGRQHARSRFTLQGMVEAYADLYRRCLSGAQT